MMRRRALDDSRAQGLKRLEMGGESPPGGKIAAGRRQQRPAAPRQQRTEEQSGSLEETASSMEEMTTTVRQNADNAGEANQLAVAARDQAEAGGNIVNKAIHAMTAINEASTRIAECRRSAGWTT